MHIRDRMMMDLEMQLLCSIGSMLDMRSIMTCSSDASSDSVDASQHNFFSVAFLSCTLVNNINLPQMMHCQDQQA